MRALAHKEELPTGTCNGFCCRPVGFSFPCLVGTASQHVPLVYIGAFLGCGFCLQTCDIPAVFAEDDAPLTFEYSTLFRLDFGSRPGACS